MMIWLHSFWGKMWQNHLAQKLVSCSRLLFWSRDQKSLWHFMKKVCWVTDLFRVRGQTVFWSSLPGVSLRAHLKANWLAVRIIFPPGLTSSRQFFLKRSSAQIILPSCENHFLCCCNSWSPLARNMVESRHKMYINSNILCIRKSLRDYFVVTFNILLLQNH